jgi:hypothetical protein
MSANFMVTLSALRVVLQPSGQYAEFIERAMQLRRVAVNPESTRSAQLIFAVPAAQQADAQHARASRRQEIPDRISHHVTIIHANPQPLLAGQEEIGLGFGTSDIAALDHDRLLT